MPELLCDLTVDAGGAGSPCLKWLSPQPAEESLTIDLFYATRFYRDPEPNNRNWTNLMISARLPALTQEPWDMALTEALRHPDIASGQGASFVMKLMQRFTERIYAASAQHKDVYLALAQAMNLTASSRIFFRPSLLGKIMTTRPNKGNR